MGAPQKLVDRRDHILTSLSGYAARFCAQDDLTEDQKMAVVAAVGEATAILAKATRFAYPDFPNAPFSFDRAMECPCHEDGREMAEEKGQVA